MADAPEYTVGDTAPALSGSVNADLTGATARVHIKPPTGAVIDQPAVIDDATLPAKWHYDWAEGDLSVRGTWTSELEATYSNGKKQTFGAASFTVRDQIA